MVTRFFWPPEIPRIISFPGQQQMYHILLAGQAQSVSATRTERVIEADSPTNVSAQTCTNMSAMNCLSSPTAETTS